MKRWTFRVALLILAGAIINVAVAWGLAIRPSPQYELLIRSQRSHDTREVDIRTALGETLIEQTNSFDFYLGALCRGPMSDAEVVSETQYRNLIPCWSSFHKSEPALVAYAYGRSNDFVTFAEHAFGWPKLSMRYSEITRTSADGLFASTPVLGASLPVARQSSTSLNLTAFLSEFSALQGTRSMIPANPIWPGFAINTIFYAAIVWMLFAVPGAVRRRIGEVRIKRGQCAACGYSLRENVSDKCPECGASVKPHRSQPRLA